MTITERPIRHAVRVETFNIGTPAPLVLDYSRLDVATLGDATSDPAGQWADWTDHLLSIDIIRGGRQDGIEVRNDTGVLTITLRGVDLGYPAPNFLRGQRIRALHTQGDPTPLFTGEVLDVVATTTLDHKGNPVPVLRVTAIDAYAKHDATTRYGALPPTGSETFTERIDRLTRTATAPIEPPIINRAPTFTPWVEQRRNVITNASFETPGVIAPWGLVAASSFGTSTEWAASGIRSLKVGLSNSTTVGDVRIGATNSFPSGVEPGKTYYVRATVNLPKHASFSSASASRQRRLLLWYIDSASNIIAQWGEQAPNTAGVHVLTGVLSIPADARGAIIAVGLAGSAADAGKVAYVDSIAASEIDGAFFDGNTNPGGELERTRWLGATNASASVIESRAFAGWSPLPDTAKILGRTVFESSMSSHLSLACNTAGAMWWIGADGVTRFAPREFDPYTAITFIGAQAPYEGAPDDALHYVRPIASAGSSAFFNRAIMHVLDAAQDPETGEWHSADYDRTTVNLGSIYGYSDAEISVNATPDSLGTTPVYEWLQPTSNFTPKATGIVWNAQEDLTRVPELEIGRSVYLTTDDIVRDPWPWNVITGIHHIITPTRWLTELTLIGVAQP